MNPSRCPTILFNEFCLDLRLDSWMLVEPMNRTSRRGRRRIRTSHQEEEHLMQNLEEAIKVVRFLTARDAGQSFMNVVVCDS